MPPALAPPTLLDELVEEIRLTPDEPACLVRASLASKLWLSLLTGTSFHGRYRDFHRAAPMLGFLLSWNPWDNEKHPGPAPRFIPIAKFSPRVPDWGHVEYDSLDCRHGRVLLADTFAGFRKLAVWDPMTGCQRLLNAPNESVGRGAAVLCSVTGCDHRSCHEGPFRVFLFGMSRNQGEQHSAHAWVYSSETDEWTKPCSPLQLGAVNAHVYPGPSLLFQNALYHKVYYPDHMAILKYDIGSNCMSLLDGPPPPGDVSGILMTMDDGSFGFAYCDFSALNLWSRFIRSDGVAAWTLRTTMDFKELLPIQYPKKRLRLIGFKEHSNIIFVTTDLGIYEINLKSLEWKKLWKKANIRALIPYMSFYNPPERTTTPRKAAH